MATAKRGTQTSRLAKVTHAQQLLDTPDGIYSCKGAYMYVFFFLFSLLAYGPLPISPSSHPNGLAAPCLYMGNS
jgi:hypothetical protein